MTSPILIPQADRDHLRLALKFLHAAVKQAKGVVERLDLERARLGQRETDADAIRELLGGWETAEVLALPPSLARSLRCGVAVEYDRLLKLQDDQLAMLRDDSDTRKALLQVEAVLRLLDGQMSLPFPATPAPAPAPATQADGETLEEAVERVAKTPKSKTAKAPAEEDEVRERFRASGRARRGPRHTGK